MFDWLRGLTKSAEIRRQERTIAYVDGTLSEQERAQFEAEMARDAALRQDVSELQQIKANLRTMPRQRVPRNFTLDPAVYGKPEPAYDVRAYPILQAATAISALVFIIMATLTLGPQLTSRSGDMASETAMVEVAQDSAADSAEEMAETIVEEVAATNVVEVEVEEVEVVVEEVELEEEAAMDTMAELEESAEDRSEALSEDTMTDDDLAMEAEMAMAEEPAEGAAATSAMASDMAADDDAMSDAAEALPQPTMAPTMQAPEPASVVVEPPAPEPTQASDGFRSQPVERDSAESTTSTETDTTDVAANTAIEATVEVQASETAPESKTTLESEAVEIETLEQAEEAVSQKGARPVWITAFALLTLLLLAATLWVRSRL